MAIVSDQVVIRRQDVQFSSSKFLSSKLASNHSRLSIRGPVRAPLRSSVALAEPGKSATVESHVGLWDDLKEYPNMLHVDLFDRLLHLLPSV